MNVVGLSANKPQTFAIGNTNQLIIVDFVTENIIIGKFIGRIECIRIKI
jgi:hypothetical protein